MDSLHFFRSLLLLVSIGASFATVLRTEDVTNWTTKLSSTDQVPRNKRSSEYQTDYVTQAATGRVGTSGEMTVNNAGGVTVHVDPATGAAVGVQVDNSQTVTYSGVTGPNSQASGVVGAVEGGSYSASTSNLSGPGSTFTYTATANGNTINISGVGPPGAGPQIAPIQPLPPIQPFPTFAPFPSMPGFPSLFPQQG